MTSCQKPAPTENPESSASIPHDELWNMVAAAMSTNRLDFLIDLPPNAEPATEKHLKKSDSVTAINLQGEHLQDIDKKFDTMSFFNYTLSPRGDAKRVEKIITVKSNTIQTIEDVYYLGTKYIDPGKKEEFVEKVTVFADITTTRVHLTYRGPVERTKLIGGPILHRQEQIEAALNTLNLKSTFPDSP